MTIIGAYISADTLNTWTPQDASDQLKRYQAYGINTIVCGGGVANHDIIQQIQSMDLRFVIDWTCFLDRTNLQATQPELQPILASGQPRPKMNWYLGITPTIPAYVDQLLQQIEAFLSTHTIDGLWLDFIRWALHWEQEIRDDTPPPLDSSFDPITLAQFAKFADITITGDTIQQQSQWILTHHHQQWIDFKCHVITDVVARIHHIFKQYHPAQPMSINIVPATRPDRERYLGQKLDALSTYADYFSPMLYHHILAKPASWITDYLNDMASETQVKFVPYVQVKALDDSDGVSPQEWGEVVQAVLDHPQTDGLLAFVGSYLHEHQRGDVLRQNIVL